MTREQMRTILPEDLSTLYAEIKLYKDVNEKERYDGEHHFLCGAKKKVSV